MATYEGEDMHRVSPQLKENEHEHILIVHDKSIFYSNDRKRGVWAQDGQLPLRKKGNGKSIMISEFLTEAREPFCLTSDEISLNLTIPEKTCVILRPGKNEEGYWTSQNLVEQVELKAIPIFETIFPECVEVFMFDNSSNHAAFMPDALVANRINIGSGGKNVSKMRDTRWEPNNQLQKMNFDDDQPKGIKQILIERGLWKKIWWVNVNYVVKK